MGEERKESSLEAEKTENGNAKEARGRVGFADALEQRLHGDRSDLTAGVWRVVGVFSRSTSMAKFSADDGTSWMPSKPLSKSGCKTASMAIPFTH